MSALTGRLLRHAVSGMIATTSLVALCSSAQAKEAPPFTTLLRQAADAPRLDLSEAEVRRAEGLSQQARSRPNPTVSVVTENFAGSAPYSGFNRAETMLQYSQPIELGGKRSARIAAGVAGVSAARARDQDTRIAFAYDLARAYVAAEISDRRIALAQAVVEEAQSDLRVARALVGAGRESRLRSLQAETALNAMTAELEVTKAARIAAYARLSALAGTEEPFTSLSESLLDRPGSAPSMGPVDPLASTAYLAALAEREAADRRLVAERKRATPDITASFGVRRLKYEKATAFMGGISIPLPIFDRNRGNVAVAVADVQAAEARLAMTRNEVRAEAQAAQAQLLATDARVMAAENGQATAEETYRLARIAYEAGKSPLAELLVARQGLSAARRVVLDARTARFEARAQLARLQAGTISGEPVQ